MESLGDAQHVDRASKPVEFPSDVLHQNRGHLEGRISLSRLSWRMRASSVMWRIAFRCEISFSSAEMWSSGIVLLAPVLDETDVR